MVFRKDSEIDAEVRLYKMEIEAIIEEYGIDAKRSAWTVANLMWLNHNLPIICRGRPKLKETMKLIVSLLRQRRRLNIP